MYGFVIAGRSGVGCAPRTNQCGSSRFSDFVAMTSVISVACDLQEVTLERPFVPAQRPSEWLATSDAPSLHDVFGRAPLSYTALRAQLTTTPQLSGRVLVLLPSDEAAMMAVVLTMILLMSKRMTAMGRMTTTSIIITIMTTITITIFILVIITMIILIIKYTIIKDIIIKSKNSIGNIAAPIPAGWALLLGPAVAMIRWLHAH